MFLCAGGKKGLYTGSHSTSSLPRRMKVTASVVTAKAVSASSTTTKVATVASGKKAAGGKSDDEFGNEAGGQKKFSFVGLIAEDLR